MKKIILFACLFVIAGMTNLTAQTCSKTAAKSCAKTAAVAEKAAKADNNIVKRLDDSGEAYYVRKTVDNGAVSFTNVKYCTKSEAFINASPSDSKAMNVANTASAKKACCASKSGAKAMSAKDVQLVKEGGKACCSKEEMKACASKKSATKTAQAAVQPKAVQVKEIEQN